MLLLRLIQYIFGYVTFKVNGGFPERFINLATACGAHVWNMRKKNGVLTGCARASHYRSLRIPARKSGATIRITSKHGLPFLLRRYRRRIGLAVGIVVAVTLPFVLSLFIWNVNIIGNSTVATSQIRSALDKIGLHSGILAASLDENALADRLLMEMEELSWASVYINGSTVTVQVRERIMSPSIVESDAPCNIVSESRGIITDIQAYVGEAAVKPGDAVTEGSLLISGTVQDRIGNTRLVHASGKITAEITQTVVFTVPSTPENTVYSGEEYKRYSLNLFGLTVPLNFGMLDGDYITVTEKDSVVIAGYELPLSLITETNKIITTEKTRISEARARELCTAAAELWKLENLDGSKIIECEYEFDMSGDGYVYSMTCVTNTEIGIAEGILVEQTDSEED